MVHKEQGRLLGEVRADVKIDANAWISRDPRTAMDNEKYT